MVRKIDIIEKTILLEATVSKAYYWLTSNAG